MLTLPMCLMNNGASTFVLHDQELANQTHRPTVCGLYYLYITHVTYSYTYLLDY